MTWEIHGFDCRLQPLTTETENVGMRQRESDAFPRLVSLVWLMRATPVHQPGSWRVRGGCRTGTVTRSKF